MRELSTILAFAASVTAASADSFDDYEEYTGLQTYPQGSYQATFECIRNTQKTFLGSEDVTLEEDDSEDFIMAYSSDYTSSVVFSGEVGESEIVTVESVEVWRTTNDSNLAPVFQSSSHINFDNRSDSPEPFQTDAYNVGFEIQPMMHARELDHMLRRCMNPAV